MRQATSAAKVDFFRLNAVRHFYSKEPNQLPPAAVNQANPGFAPGF